MVTVEHFMIVTSTWTYCDYDAHTHSSYIVIVTIVPDRRSRILEVVLVRRLVIWVLGSWRGEGMGKG